VQGLDKRPSSPALHQGLRPGEVSRHFDSNTSAAITGWLSHEPGFRGWGVVAHPLGIGQLGLSGTSKVDLTSSGTARDNLMGDGFVAAFERDTQDGPIPSESLFHPNRPQGNS
jgi:hypothetical protein